MGWDVVVIGGGPAGMMAAITAGRRGLKVLLLDQNKRLGAKLAITGGGRCNILNAEPETRALLKHYGKAAEGLYSPFSQFGMKDAYTFFEDEGLPLVVEERGRAFPASHKAEDVVNVLSRLVIAAGVELRLGCQVTQIVIDKGVIAQIETSHGAVKGQSYIVACGGMSHPETGSTGDGFRWLAEAGHRVKAPTPGIVPLAVKERWVRPLAGKAVEGRVTFWLDEVRQFRVEGRVLFTHVGLSGPTILNSAAKVGNLLQAGVVEATIDLFPKLDEGAVDRRVTEIVNRWPNKELKSLAKEWLPPGVAGVVIELTGLDGAIKGHQLTKVDRKRLVSTAKRLPLTISHLLGFDKAVVADGGVSLGEIDTRTMRSMMVENMFIIGDLLDINRPSGGYSLQLCWTSGYVAGSWC